MNTKVSAIVISILAFNTPFRDMTDEFLTEHIIKRFRCSKHIAKQAVKKLRDERL